MSATKPSFSRRSLLICVAIAAACFYYSPRAIPVTELSVTKENLIARSVRFHVDAATVMLTVDSIAFPLVTGTVREAAWAPVRFDLRFATASYRGTLTNPSAGKPHAARGQRLSLDSLRRDPRGLTGPSLWWFETQGGNVMLQNISRVDGTVVEGELVGGNGEVTIDLNRVTKLEVMELDAGRSIALTALTVGAVVGVAAIIVALTKSSCPFAYVDRGHGWELVGEAYAGAAFRSIQREDLLPLPPLDTARRARVRLRNEARETQYTDFAELVVVDHSPSSRALSTFDGHPILVKHAVPVAMARDNHGRDVTRLLAQADNQLWVTDPEAAAAVAEPPYDDVITAEFRADSAGTPVLELIGGNTPWLDLVFGRFFAAMGDRMATYLAQGNEAAAGARIQRWREREGVDLAVEIRTAAGWTRVGTVPTIGPASVREVAVPLPRSVAAGERVEVRLRGGLAFWRFDRLALSIADTVEPVVHHIAATSALSFANQDQHRAIERIDGSFNALPAMSDTLDMEFQLPPRPRGQERAAFLHTSGYYNVHAQIQAQWLPATLKAIRDEPGGLAKFGRDLAREYVSRVHATTSAQPIAAR